MSEQLGPQLEPEMEKLLARYVPDFESKVTGASQEEINALEKIAGQPLPKYYKWFLWRMGNDMGPFGYKSLDFSAKTILEKYEQGKIKSDPRHLVVGYETDPMYADDVIYKLDKPVRDDAQVDDKYETLREMHAYGIVLEFGVYEKDQTVTGVFYHEADKSVPEILISFLEKEGFVSLVPAGNNCLFYEKQGIVVVGFARLNRGEVLNLAVTVGGNSKEIIQDLLNAIKNETGLEFDVDEWGE